MNIEHLYESKDINFWMVPKFILNTFENTQTGIFYSLLRAKRNLLIRNKKLKSYNDWFYYPEQWLKDDLRKPNSANHILKLLKELKDTGLIDFKNSKYKPYTRMYWINDAVFNKMAKDYANNVNHIREKRYEEMKKHELEEDSFDPLGYDGEYLNY